MNERDLEIMGIADDLLDQQNKLIEQQGRAIDYLIKLLEDRSADVRVGISSVLREGRD